MSSFNHWDQPNPLMMITFRPCYSGNYSPEHTGISALKNSDILTAVTIIAGDIARFPLLKKDFTGNIEQDGI